MTINNWFNQDINQAVPVRFIEHGNMFSHNGDGNILGVYLYNNGSPYTVTGTVTGYAVLPDGTTVPCVGSKSGNSASVIVPAAAYQPGQILVSVFISDGTHTTTVLAVSVNVVQARTGTQVDPGSVVSDWTDTINAAMQEVETAAEALETAAGNIFGVLAVPYADLTFPVALGKYMTRNGNVYRCITPIPSSESYTAAHWTQIRVCDDIYNINNILNTVVRYTEQSPSASAKAQARANIDAVGNSEYSAFVSDVEADKQSTLTESVNEDHYYYYRAGSIVGVSSKAGYNGHSVQLSNVKDFILVDFSNLSGMEEPVTDVLIEITNGNQADDTIYNYANRADILGNKKPYIHYNNGKHTLLIDCQKIRNLYPAATYVLFNTLAADTAAKVTYDTNTIEGRLAECEEFTLPMMGGLSGKQIPMMFVAGSISVHTGVDFDSTAMARSTPVYAYTPLRIAPVDDTFQFYILQYSTSGAYIGTFDGFVLHSEVALDAGYIYRILVVGTDIEDITTHISEVQSAFYCFPVKREFFVSKDGLGDFTDVQTCIDYLPKTQDYTITINIGPGTYDKICTMCLKKYVESPTNQGIQNSWRRRRLNLIGDSPENTIIRSDTGEYFTPAAEISLIGEVRNICFITTHDSPPADRSEDPNYLNHKGYAVHSDYDTEDVFYNHCIGISHQAPGWGCGGAANKRLRFNDCRAFNLSPASGEYALGNYGGIYYHLSNHADITGQFLEIKDSYMYCENGNKALWVQIPSQATNYGQETHLYHNIIYGKECGATAVVGSGLLSGDSYGNNAPDANAT